MKPTKPRVSQDRASEGVINGRKGRLSPVFWCEHCRAEIYVPHSEHYFALNPDRCKVYFKDVKSC